MADMEMGH